MSSQIKPTAEVTTLPTSFAVDPISLSDIMDPKCDKSLFDKVGGSVEAIAASLNVDLTKGISGSEAEVKARMDTFGGNFFAEAAPPSYLELVWAGLQDQTIIMLCLCALVGLIMELSINTDHGGGVPGWVEPIAILVTVSIVVNVAAGIDFQKDIMFRELNKKLEKTNKRQVIRGGAMTEVTDREIVVGDLLIFNNVLQSSVPADGVFVRGDNVKMDQGALTGEPEPVPKGKEFDGEHSNPLIFSGTEVKSGSGVMLVVAVGALSFSGKIREQVYGEGLEEEPSPLFKKLDKLAMDIGKLGVFVAGFCLLAMSIVGFFVDGLPFKDYFLDYLITAITILVVAVPEGLPLAVTLSLAFSSFQMSNENNLVKHLDACETMGSATTICSDKTGTLTQNRMTVRAAWTKDTGIVEGSSGGGGGNDSSLAEAVKSSAAAAVAEPLGRGICVNTMDESYFGFDDVTKKIKFTGQPTECALLKFASDLGYDYNTIRRDTPGRSEETVKTEGKKFDYSSARKMMSWAVRSPSGDGGYRIYSKGGGEVVLPRCSTVLSGGAAVPMPLEEEESSNARAEAEAAIDRFASQAMRTIALAYRDLPAGVDFAQVEGPDGAKQPDGSPAFSAETQLTLLGVVGIEDPLRDEVPPAIQKCYTAGIDVRMVTGDNLQTAVAIASRCGILRAEHFTGDFNDPQRRQLKPFRAMTGEDFRKKVSVLRDYTDEKTGLPRQERVIVQAEFDKVWPYLRVMARCDPSDKQVLADGLNKSLICEDAAAVARFKNEEGITIFPDRQVVAMTGDGTNDAPALKRADVGFAMGIAGTPTAKDAADIILLDDNFASIVTAAKWGRNVYDSIQKFLQFQLTVNMSALSLATVGALWMQKSPLSATQLLWLNLLMDSLASLALATEPPSEKQLNRPPVNRSTSIITKRMWYNMIGQAAFQTIVVVLLMLEGDKLAPKELEDADVNDGVEFYEQTHKYSQQYTIIFHTYVNMQLVNEINCRKLEGEMNVFEGITNNPYFYKISLLTFLLQFLLAQFAGPLFGCSGKGLTVSMHIFCYGVSLFSIPWQMIINFMANKTLHMEETKGVGGGVMKFGKGKILHGSRSGSFRGLSQTSFDTRNQEAKVLERSISLR